MSLKAAPAATNAKLDFDWLVIGSGFGGSVSALRLAEKGYRVGVLERGRRYRDEDLPQSAWQFSKFVWAPMLGLQGIMRNQLFRHVFSSAQTGVGGGSLVYGGVLFRAQAAFFEDLLAVDRGVEREGHGESSIASHPDSRN